MLVHVAILLLLALVVPAITDDGSRVVSLNFSEEQFEEPTLLPQVHLESKTPVMQVASAPPAPGEFKGSRLDSLLSTSAVFEPMENAGNHGIGTSLSEAVEREIAAAVSETNQQVNGPQAQFFGIQSSGRRFVFVIDSSKSMSGQKWVRACRELWKSLESMNAEQEFFVVFFDQEAHPMLKQKYPELSMMKSDPENITKLKRWTASLRFGHSTFPLTSLECAISLKPDAIFLLSDGEFQDDSVAFLRSRNSVKDKDDVTHAAVPIHTVAFQSLVGAETLSEIAAEHEGQFRFVK
jgi:hypothetical protein